MPPATPASDSAHDTETDEALGWAPPLEAAEPEEPEPEPEPQPEPDSMTRHYVGGMSEPTIAATYGLTGSIYKAQIIEPEPDPQLVRRPLVSHFSHRAALLTPNLCPAEAGATAPRIGAVLLVPLGAELAEAAPRVCVVQRVSTRTCR
eukprot:COSAG04_NODE_4206_length_2234_cov_25.062295_2_plen_148_part_00